MASFDVIGSKDKAVAIIEGNEGKEIEIAQNIMDENENIKTVLKKLSERKGRYRTREYKIVAGGDDTEVIHKEHGYMIKVDPLKSYFSVRESTERQRVAEQVSPGEVVMVMFAGVGPYAIAIAKRQPKVEKVVCVEINPHAVEYMKDNIRINKLSHKIVPVLGDVRDVSSEWYGKCDRVVMPLPLESKDFLDIAVYCCKKGGVVHFYSKGNESDGNVFSEPLSVIDDKMKSMGIRYETLSKRTVLPYAPGRFKVCIEFKIL